MISIHTNLSSIIAQNSLSTSTNKLNQDSIKNDASINLYDSLINLQVGINGNIESQIEMHIGFFLSNINILKGIGRNKTDYTYVIDIIVNNLSKKQTELGAVQNRSESALNSIEVNIHNLTSSRSTLRDADIAKESARFVQEQILQEASATLLATANQTPAIALQLL